MQSEAARIASFKTVKKYSRRSSIQGSRDWPHPLDGGYLAVPATLAEAGFYHDPYALYPDNVTCFICKEEYAEWEAGDNPHEIHLKISPKCSWALVRCSLEFDKDEEGHFEFRTKTRVPTSKTLEKARFETFGGKTEDWWPHQSASHGCNANKMAQAGFVFTPDNVPGDDTATCMYCDTSLSGWEINDDPLIEHSRRPASRECAFILSLNLTAKPPQPKAKRKARGAAKIEGEKTEKKPQQEARHVNKEKPKLKTTKPEEIPLPPSPKKKNRPILGGIDFNKPVRAPAPSPPNNAPKKPGDRLGEIFGSYQTIKKLGAGSFGDVYLGVDLVSNRQVAIKLESTKASVVMLKVEAKMYETLRGAAGIPVMKWFGTVRDYNVLVLPVLGRSLLSVLDACGGHFSLPTVLMMADQLIARIQSLHSYGMIHRDLKPDNFLIGRELWDKTIYLIDFGMAKAYRTPGGIHIPWKTGRGFWGNSRYASLGAHDGEEQSRRNDMEALGYIFIDCLKRLPWPAPRRVANEYDDYTPIADAKRRIPISTLCAGLPVEFALFLRHARSLTFEATPDYQGMRYMFQQLAWRLGYGPDMPYDWSMLGPTRAACSTPRRVVTSNVHNYRPPMVKALTIPFLGPRPNPAGEYFRRVYPEENVHKDESDVLKSIRQVIRSPISRQIRQTILYPSHESTLDEGFFHDVELSWNSCCVILSAGAIICRKWTLEEEDQDIQWACKGLLEVPGGVAEGFNASVSVSVSSTSPEELEASSTSTSAFSRFAESAKARQRAITPPRLVSAVFVFLRSIGKIFTENGEEYTFNMPFLVRRAWPLRPHGVLLQRAVTQVEESESAQTGEPLLPTLFSLHDPFAEFKVVGVAAHIHGALGPTGLPSAITQVDPNNPPDIKNPEDFDFTSFPGPKPAHSRNMQGNPPPPPPAPERPPPLQQPPATDKVLWISEDITVGTASESIIVTCTAPIPSSQAQSRSGETPKSPGPSRQPKPHRYAHQVHLSIWRYAYLKPREIPDPVLKKRSQNNVQDKPIHDTKEPNSSTTSTPRHPRDPATIRRRELQDRADRIPPSSPPLGAAPPSSFPPPPPSTIPFSLPRQPISTQPTLASLPGGELPSSWSHPFHPQSLRPTPGHERQASQDQLRIPAVVPEPQTIKEVSENKEDIIGTRMDSGHKKIRPSIWVEKISAIPIPPEDQFHPDKITVHLFDTRFDHKFHRSLLAVHYPASRRLSIYVIVRIPHEDTLRVCPPVHVPAISACAISAFRHSVLDLLIVTPDNNLVVLTHGTRLINLELRPRPFWSTFHEKGHRHESSANDDAMPVDEPSDVLMHSMHSFIDKERIVGVSEPLHNSVTIHFEDGTTTRSKIEYIHRDELTKICFVVLSFALTTQRAFDLHLSWLHKVSALNGLTENDEEWECFVDAVCDLLKVESPNHRKANVSAFSTAWEALAYSTSNARFENDRVLELLDLPFMPSRQSTGPPSLPAEDIDPCLLALHLLAEGYKLRTDAVHAFLPRLARLLIALARAIRPEWADYWARVFPENLQGWAGPKRETEYPTRLRPQPPDIYLYLFSRLIEPHSKAGWTTLIHIGQMYQFEPALQYGRIDPLQDIYRFFNVWECFTDLTVPTARKRAENAMQTMVRLGITNDDLDNMPPGLAQPIREALRTCQTLPSGDWSATAYNLILRPDFAQMIAGDAFHMTSRDSFRQVNKHSDPSWSRATVGELVAATHAAMESEPPAISGVELDLGDFTDIRFGSDRRIQEVARMLQSSSPPNVKMPDRNDLTEHEIAREQQTTALRVAERTLALPVGRAMFTFGTVPTVTRDVYQVPKMEFTVRVQPYNTLVTVDVTKINPEAKNWADFHNGVAAGLRLSPTSKMIDSSWIIFNRPAELTAEHAGFLFGLGLTCHLKNLLTWHTFSYLTPKHDLTSIGVLLGLSVAHVGTANRHVMKLLAVHTPALLPNPSVDLNIGMLTQAAGLVGMGLLYLGTTDRRMAELALHEISRTQLNASNQAADHREAYALSAALAFGMIMLGGGANTTSLADMNMISRLRILIHGEPLLPGNRLNRDSFDVSLTSAPATLALALMFLKTGREDIVDVLTVPNTLLELHRLQPSFLLVRTLGRALIMWDKITPTPQWVTDQLPKSALEALEQRMMGKHIDESLELAYFNIISGACFAMGLKYAGTAQEDPYTCLIHFHDLFTRISNQNSGQFDHRIKRAAVRDGLNLMSLALSMVMAGTGEINCLRRFRFSHGQAIQQGRYGVHMATHMAIGMLFLGGGRYTLGTSNAGIAALLAAFYPRFPTLSHENRGHLQALRHLWVLAVEPRCLIGRDVESNEVVYLPVKVKLREGKDTRAAQLISPTLFPDINRLLTIRVDNPRYFPFILDIANNQRHRDVLLRNQTLWVKRRTGHLGYGEDPRGSRSIYVRSGASSGDAAVLDNPKPSDVFSPSSAEFYQFISSFSNEAFYVAFADRFCRNDGTDEEELIFSAFSQAAMLECLTLDRAHMLPTYLSIHLTRRIPHWTPLALRDLAWHDEFYKNIYDARFSGKSDNAALPPLMRRPLLLAAERDLELRMRDLRQNDNNGDLKEGLKRYHCAEGLSLRTPMTANDYKAQKELLRNLGFFLTRTNIPPPSVLQRMRIEAEATSASLLQAAQAIPPPGQSANAMGEEAVLGLLWNTGVLFAGGILRPWTIKALREVRESWGQQS